MCTIVPPTMVSPYTICLGAVAFLEVTFVPKFLLFASIPFEVSIERPDEINVVANVTAAIAAAPVKPNALNAAAPTPPVVATTKTTSAATTAALIALATRHPPCLDG